MLLDRASIPDNRNSQSTTIVHMSVDRLLGVRLVPCPMLFRFKRASSAPHPTVNPNVHNGDWIPQQERLLSAWNIGFVLTGLLLFSLGTMLQMTTPRYPEMDTLVDACISTVQPTVRDSILCKQAVLKFDHVAHRADGINWGLGIGDLLRGLGTALVLSIVISVTLERQNRSQFMMALTNKTRELSLSVFAGMFNRNHPDALLTAVKSQILERDLIRDSISVSYTLSLWTPPRGSARLNGRRFVRVDVILSSTVTNVSTLRGVDAGIARVPLGLALPNPMLDELKPEVKVSKFMVGGDSIASSEIDAANVKLQVALSDDEIEDGFVDFGFRDVQPGESLSVSANYTMMKEAEDTEVFRTLQIARSLSLTVNDNTNGQLKVRARSIHPSPLEKMASGSATTQWRLSDIILPQQGIMVWWKAPAMDPCAGQSAGSESQPVLTGGTVGTI